MTIHARTHTHTHQFNGPLSGTTRVSQYQSEWQWHQLGRVQVCSSLQTNNHASTPPLSSLQASALPATQPTASKHCRYSTDYYSVDYSPRNVPMH